MIENNNNERELFYRQFTISDKQSLHEVKFDKDRFVELAQEALEQVKLEEEQVSVFQELLEVFIAKTGAPQVAHVILEQFKSQDVIEKTAEDLYYEQQQKTACTTLDAHALKEPVHPLIEDTREPVDNTTMMFVSEYLWKLFRLLLLASTVCLVYHYFIM